jgi:hypothetical protein
MAEQLQNQVAIDFTDNPELASVFATKQPGDKCKMEIEFLITEKETSGVKGKIVSIAPEGYEPNDKDEPSEIEPDAKTSPVMIVINARNKKTEE